MGEVNFYLKTPVVYTCKKHPDFIQWEPGSCPHCKKLMTIRKNKEKRILPMPTGSPPPQLIYLQFRYRGNKFVYSTGESVLACDWDKEKQKVRSRSRTTENKKYHLNDFLRSLEDELTKIYNSKIVQGVPTNGILKKALDEYVNRNFEESNITISTPTFFQLIDKFIAGEIGAAITPGTIKTYQTAKVNLAEFARDEKYPVTYDTIDVTFCERYVKYLKKQRTRLTKNGKKIKVHLSANSIHKEIKNVKTFMNRAVEEGYTTNLSYKSKKFRVKTEDTTNVFLTPDELSYLYRFDFENDKQMEAVRDVFIFQSHVGMRYSDVLKLKGSEIVKDEKDGRTYIRIYTGKTKTYVSIYCNKTVLEIFKKYHDNENRLPYLYTLQKYNVYLKQMCKKAGLTEKGRYAKNMEMPLYKVIGSHTARRNYITNAHANNIDRHTIRQSTGHSKNSKSFEHYIRETPDESARRMARMFEEKGI